MKIELELDLDKHLARHIGYDEEGEPVQHPTTVEDIVIGLAAEKVAAAAYAADKQYDGLRARVTRITDETIREMVRPAIEAALAKTTTPTDPYGNPKGEPSTLEEHIIEVTRKMLVEKRSKGYGHPERTLVQGWIVDAIDYKVARELGEALEEGKAQVKKALQDEGARIMAEAIGKMAKA